MPNKMLCFLLLLCCIQFIKAQQIIDTSFAAVIRSQCPACIDENNQLTAAADTLQRLLVKEWKVKSLEGINFPNLAFFECSFTNVEELPPLNFPNLKHFECRHNYDLFRFDSFYFPQLEKFVCDAVFKLTQLPALNFPNLKHFECKFTDIDTFPALDFPNLEYFDCIQNELTDLPELNFYRLRYFDCADNELTNLSDFNFPNLEDFDCADNKLTRLPELNFPKLNFLSCGGNPIDSLPVLPDSLVYLRVRNTQIKCLPNRIPPKTDIQLPICNP